MGIQLGSAFGKIELDASGVKRGVQQATGALSGFQQSIKSIMQFTIGNLVATGLRNLVGGLQNVGRETKTLAMDFESQMAILSMAVDTTVVSLDELHAAAIQVGGDTELVGIDASQAAEAMTGLFKAGLTVTDVFGDMGGYLEGTASLSGALRAAVDLQAASELDLARASDIVAVTMKTFGLSAEDATAITDNFVQTADASVASVASLAEAMENVGPTAAAFGWTLEDTNTALALLSTRGIDGAEAGTALKSMMVNLMRPTDTVQEAMMELGVSLYDMEGVLKQLPDIVGEMGLALDGLTDEQRNQYIQTLAGSYGMKAMNTLLAEGVEGWEAMAGAVGDASTAQEVAAARADTLAGAQETLEGVMETLKIQVGETLIPVWRQLAETFTVLTERYGPQITAFFEGLSGAIGGIIDALGGLATGEISLGDMLPPVVMENMQLFQDALAEVGRVIREDILPAIIEFLPTLQEWGGQLLELASGVLPVLGEILKFVAEHWREFAAGLAAVGAILAGAQIVAGIGAVVAAIAAIANPITLVVGAVALLAAAWTGNWGGVRDTLLGVWAAIQPTLQTLWNWLATNIPVAIETLSGFWTNRLLPAIRMVWGFIENSLLPVYRAVADVMRAVVGKALEWLAAYFTNKMVPAIKATWKVIDELLVPVIKAVLGPALLWLKDSVLAPLVGAFDGIGGAIKSVVDWLKKLADNIRGIELPDWLTPGSPTPFELGLLGIAEAMRGLAAVEVPRLAGAFGGALAPAAVGMGGSGYGDYRSYPVTVQVERVGDEVDIEVLAYRVAEVIGRRAG